MEKIISNPGLQHLAEKVFWNLDVEELKICAQINQSCKQILQNPIFSLRKFENLSKESQKDWIKIIQSVKNSNYEKVIVSFLQWNLKKEVVEVDLSCFWFKKFRSLSEENQKDWIKVIQSEKNFEKGIAIISYLRWNLQKYVLVDLPCYYSLTVQNDFRQRIRKTCKKQQLSEEDLETVKILAPLTEHLNAPDQNGRTPIHEAAWKGHTEIVKILVPLTDNPNATDEMGKIPIYDAAFCNHADIVKILASLTDNPNAPIQNGNTPIQVAACNGHTEIVKILVPLTDNPNASDNDGETPIYSAAEEGHTEIVKILAPLTNNPNAPDKYGSTPIFYAAFNGYTEIVKILAPFTDNPNAPDKFGKTPIQVAKNEETQRFLKSFNKLCKNQ